MSDRDEKIQPKSEDPEVVAHDSEDETPCAAHNSQCGSNKSTE